MPRILTGLALMVVGTELYLAFAAWPLLILVGTGLAVLGWRQAVGLRRNLVWSLVAILIFSAYFTLTAFFRYPGLTKDVEPAVSQLAIYFLRIAVASLFLVGTILAFRAGVARFLTSRTWKRPGLADRER